MIGGIDVHLPTRAGDVAIEAAVRAIRSHWPNAVFENGDSGEPYDRFEQIPFGGLSELFVYRDAEAARHWDEEGAIPPLYNTMIHLLGGQDLITVVVDKKDAHMQQIIDTISSALNDPLLYTPALLEAA